MRSYAPRSASILAPWTIASSTLVELALADERLRIDREPRLAPGREGAAEDVPIARQVDWPAGGLGRERSVGMRAGNGTLPRARSRHRGSPAGSLTALAAARRRSPPCRGRAAASGGTPDGADGGT